MFFLNVSGLLLGSFGVWTVPGGLGPGTSHCQPPEALAEALEGAPTEWRPTLEPQGDTRSGQDGKRVPVVGESVPADSLCLQVVAEGGASVERVALYYCSMDASYEQPEEGLLRLGSPWKRVYDAAFSSGVGTFKPRGRGPFVLAAQSLPAFGLGFSEPVELGGTVRLVLPALDQGLMVTGSLRKPGGESLAYANVQFVWLEDGVRRHERCVLEGHILLDGAAPPNRPLDLGPLSMTGYRVAMDRGLILDSVCESPLVSDGSFRLETGTPGSYFLRIELPVAGGLEWRVLDRIEMRAGTHPWKLELDTGSVLIKQLAKESKLKAYQSRLIWKGLGDLRIFPDRPERAKGSQSNFYPCVPVGSVQYCNDPGDGRRIVLSQGSVKKGASTTLE